MFAVSAPQGVRYTRDGSFNLTPDGTLVTNQGYPVLDNQGNTINVGSTGEVHIANTGQIEVNGKQIATLGVYDGTYAKEGGNLWTASDATVETEPNVRQSTLESSNVNPMSAMIDMIKISRAVEMAQKSIQSQDDSTEKLIGSLSS
jgi:flagellar basal-body rod protein FlgF